MNGRRWVHRGSLSAAEVLAKPLSGRGGFSGALNESSKVFGEIFDVFALDVLIAHKSAAEARSARFATPSHVIAQERLITREDFACDFNHRLTCAIKSGEITGASTSLFMMVNVIFQNEHFGSGGEVVCGGDDTLEDVRVLQRTDEFLAKSGFGGGEHSSLFVTPGLRIAGGLRYVESVVAIETEAVSHPYSLNVFVLVISHAFRTGVSLCSIGGATAKQADE